MDQEDAARAASAWFGVRSPANMTGSSRDPSSRLAGADVDVDVGDGRLLGANPSAAIGRLRRLNLAAGLLHGVQAVALIALSNGFSLPVTAAYLDGPPGGAVSPDRLRELFAYPLGSAVAAFSMLSAIFHFVVASPWGFRRYHDELARSRNRFRWVEYSLSASLMIVLIAGITGISDAAALVALFGVNASMILFGWLMETTNDLANDQVSWTPFVMGCVAGLVPWLAIALYLFGAGSGVPNFVYGIFASLFIFFNSFALNQLLQYRRVGPWRNYLLGERMYIALSLVAKSVLAWQVFANVLV
jgi:Heliorhodopsin